MAQNANDIYTMTPGSAVADTLQSILTRQEVEKRQAMLDTVNAANVKSEIGTREDNAATNKAYREGLIADRQAKETERQTTQGHLKALSDYASQQYPDDPVENNMWRTIEADPERGMPMYQAWMTHKLTNDPKAKNLVPAYRFDDVTKKTIPVMVPGTPPLVGEQPLMVPEGSPLQLQGISRAQEQSSLSGAQQALTPVGTDEKGLPVYSSNRMDAHGMPQMFHPKADGTGWEPYMGKMTFKGAIKPPVPLYTQASVNNLISAVKSNPRAANTAIEAWIGLLGDPSIKWDVSEFLRHQNDPTLPVKVGVEEAVQHLNPPANPDSTPPDPATVEAYRNNFRQVMNIIMQAKGNR